MTTPVRNIYSLFRRDIFDTVMRTREREVHVWDDFWTLLIVSGYRFHTDDLSGYNWFEHHYTTAVAWNNGSLCRAYEQVHGRRPFVGKVIEYPSSHHPRPAHATVAKSQGRLVIGASFRWEGERVTVTSFQDEKHSLIACSYQGTSDGYTFFKIKRRFTITHDAWRKAQKRKKGEK